MALRIHTRFTVKSRIRCPGCGTDFPLSPDAAGKQLEGNCPSCGKAASVAATGLARLLLRASGGETGEGADGGAAAPAEAGDPGGGTAHPPRRGGFPFRRKALREGAEELPGEGAGELPREGGAVRPPGAPPERAASTDRRRWRRISFLGNATGVAVALWAIFLPRPYPLAVGTAALVPFLLLLVLRWSDGRIRLVDKEKDKGPFLTAGFLLPALAVALRGTVDFQFESLSPLLRPTGAVALGLVLGAWLALRELRESVGKLLLVSVFLAMFAWGIVIEANCLGDPSPPAFHAVQLLGKRKSTSGRSPSYYLELPPWGPRTAPAEVTVGRWLYNGVERGATVTVVEKGGRLGIPWYYVRKGTPPRPADGGRAPAFR